ncbi:MAG TPA: hypothetical protein VJ761_25220 [Ktedonobacteraceae bacterium]|nr:hypothetical protein [Ktedonobacteraceae bacterium]
MSQQEFDSGSQAPEDEPLHEEVYYPRAPYSWSGRLDNEAMPRDEPPFGYGEPTQQQAADANPFNSSRQQQEHSGEDGNVYQRGYGPYNSYNSSTTGNVGSGTSAGQGQSVPPWARPQQHQRRPFRFGFIILILVVIAVIQMFMANGGVFVGAAGDIFGTILSLLLFVLIVPIVIVLVFWGFLVRMLRSGRRQRWRGRSWPNGPFWW